ncbi:MAG TPA: c-type cytochrome [Ktedonobacteraceae bacterium]|nr:c-type cytochrome [Ktedonobacteraceae bacterium]
MIDPGQAVIGIVVMLVAVGALLYIFYSRTNSVEKTGYGALIMLAIISLMIPIFWIMESNAEAQTNLDQHTLAVTRGATLFAQYCYQCHGTKGQGRSGPKLNNNSAVNNLTDSDLLRIISGGIYDPANPGGTPLMPAWSDRFGGPLTDDDIQYLFTLIRSSDPAYLQKNGYPSGSDSNGFTQVPSILQTANVSVYKTAVAQESGAQFGAAVDMTGKTAVTIDIVQPPAGATCSPACFGILNVKVKVGTKITWVNQSQQAHTVTAIVGLDPTNQKPAPQIFDSGIATGIATGATYSYTVTMAAYNFNPNHAVVYYCQYHPGMIAELTIVP